MKFDRDRLREVLRFLPVAVVMYLVSRVMFDFITNKPQFWQAEGGWVTLLWNASFAIPFIVFALMVASQRKSSGN
jgi:hypothetical protein